MRKATKGTRGPCERLNYRRSCVASFFRRHTRTLALREARFWPICVSTFSMAIIPPPYTINLLIIFMIPFASTLSTVVMAPSGHAHNSDLSCSRPTNMSLIGFRAFFIVKLRSGENAPRISSPRNSGREKMLPAHFHR